MLVPRRSWGLPHRHPILTAVGRCGAHETEALDNENMASSAPCGGCRRGLLLMTCMAQGRLGLPQPCGRARWALVGARVRIRISEESLKCLSSDCLSLRWGDGGDVDTGRILRISRKPGEAAWKPWEGRVDAMQCEGDGQMSPGSS